MDLHRRADGVAFQDFAGALLDLANVAEADALALEGAARDLIRIAQARDIVDTAPIIEMIPIDGLEVSAAATWA